MTIQDYVLDIQTETDIDQLYVKNSKGEYISVPGDTEFKDVKVTSYDGCSVDLEFIVA